MFAFPGSQNPICLAALGDSITGWTDSIGPGYFKGFIQQLQTDLPNRVITNFGVGGYTTSSIRDRWLSMVKNCGYRQITVLGGINDIIGATTGSTVIANLDTIYDQAIALGVKIFALKMLPFGAHTLWNSTRQSYLQQVNDHIDTKTAANPSLMTMVDTYAMFGSPGDATVLNPTYDNGDGLHPNGAGQAMLAAYMKGIIL